MDIELASFLDNLGISILENELSTVIQNITQGEYVMHIIDKNIYLYKKKELPKIRCYKYFKYKTVNGKVTNIHDILDENTPNIFRYNTIVIDVYILNSITTTPTCGGTNPNGAPCGASAKSPCICKIGYKCCYDSIHDYSNCRLSCPTPAPPTPPTPPPTPAPGTTIWPKDSGTNGMHPQNSNTPMRICSSNVSHWCTTLARPGTEAPNKNYQLCASGTWQTKEQCGIPSGQGIGQKTRCQYINPSQAIEWCTIAPPKPQQLPNNVEHTYHQYNGDGASCNTFVENEKKTGYIPENAVAIDNSYGDPSAVYFKDVSFGNSSSLLKDQFSSGTQLKTTPNNYIPDRCLYQISPRPTPSNIVPIAGNNGTITCSSFCEMGMGGGTKDSKCKDNKYGVQNAYYKCSTYYGISYSKITRKNICLCVPPTPPTPPAQPTPGPTCTNKGYQKCGGKNFDGSTCCPTGYQCCKSNEYYWQCLPSSAPCPTPSPPR